MTASLSRAMNYCFDSYSNVLYSHTFSEGPQLARENLQLLQKMEAIVKTQLAKSDSSTLNLDLSIPFTRADETDWSHVGAHRKGLMRTLRWIQALQNKASKTECIELPYLAHMSNFSSLCKILESGNVRVSSHATPGAWFASKTELLWGTYGVLLDIHHAPRGNYMYGTCDNHQEIAFDRPFNFNKDGTLHLSGIIVRDMREAKKVRETLHKTKKELPDHLFVTTKEAALRCWVTSQAREQSNLPSLNDYLFCLGGNRLRSDNRIETIQKAAMGLAVIAVAFLFGSKIYS